MNLCNYGCGKKGKYQFKNGKWCCSKIPANCEAIKKNIHRKIKCKYCDEFYNATRLKKHEETCYLNPLNKKLCPICKKPIKDYKSALTCSYSCANIFIGYRGKEKNLHYRTLCFKYHEKCCVVCGENILVEVHHYDGNCKNNNIENLIPLCPTHHKYWHSKHISLIREKVDLYVKNFNKTGK